MNTKSAKTITTVGLKEFRANVAKYAKRACNNAEEVVVTSHNKPLFKVTPLDEQVYSDSLLEAVQAGKRDRSAGRVYTQEQVLQALHR